MTKEIVTVEAVLALGPCENYTENDAALLRRLLGDGIPFSDALRHPHVSQLDRLWLATQWTAHHDRNLMVCWLDVIVERAVRTHAVGCGVPDVERWAQSWLDGDEAARAARATAAAEAARATAAARAAWAARAAAEATWAAWAARSAAAETDWQLAMLVDMVRSDDA